MKRRSQASREHSRALRLSEMFAGRVSCGTCGARRGTALLVLRIVDLQSGPKVDCLLFTSQWLQDVKQPKIDAGRRISDYVPKKQTHASEVVVSNLQEIWDSLVISGQGCACDDHEVNELQESGS